MFPAEAGDYVQPNQDEPDIQPCKPGKGQVQLCSKPHDARLKHVAKAHKKGIDRRLGLVLGLARRGQ
jgi:hypothetical protein